MKLKAESSGEPGCKPGAGPGSQPGAMGMSAKLTFLVRPLVDASGVNGRYDFTLEWSAALPGPEVAGETLRDALEG